MTSTRRSGRVLRRFRMNGVVLAAGVLALLLTIYLFVALFKPEAFE